MIGVNLHRILVFHDCKFIPRERSKCSLLCRFHREKPLQVKPLVDRSRVPFESSLHWLNV